MKPPPQRWSRNSHIVVGVDAVQSLRSHDAEIPIVALVDQRCSMESALAQAAGADVVLTIPNPHAEHDDIPGLDIALRTATTIARCREQVAVGSRKVSHDLAQALNVIALAAEAGIEGQLSSLSALGQIADLAKNAGADAWRSGRAHRSSSHIISRVDLRQLLSNIRLDVDSRAKVEIVTSSEELFVFADERQIVAAVTELVENSCRSGASSVRVESMTSGQGCFAEILVSDDGHAFGSEQQANFGQPFNTPPLNGAPNRGTAAFSRLGLGLAAISEYAAELGGELVIRDAGLGDEPTQVVLSLPTINSGPMVNVARSATVDQASAQADVLEGVVKRVPLEESLEAVVAAIEHLLPGTICSVLLLDPGQTLHHLAGERLPVGYRDEIDGVAIGLGQGSCGTAAHTGRSVMASDVTVDPNWTDFCEIATTHGLRSCWSTPIVAAEGDEVLGTFAVYKETVWKPDEVAIRLVGRFSYLAAVAIEHHRLFGALAESEARFRNAFEGTAAGIALVSLEGSFLKINPALSELVGYDEAELVGTNLLDLIEDPHRSFVSESWKEAGATSAAPLLRSVNVPLETTGGTAPVWLSLRSSLISSESDRQPYLYIEARDVTAARKQLFDLRAREVAEAANQAKSDVLALVSHELRTPLNVILGFAQVMQLVDLDQPERSDSVDQIVKAGRHLRDLIDGLLDLSRIDSGQLAMEEEQVETGAVIREAMELVGPLAAARHIEVVNNMASGAEFHVVADRRCLRQVLINLLDNAVKYTPDGGFVEVDVSVSPDGCTRISVADSGPGIPSDSLEDVFQPFKRLDRAADERHNGTGLGLALCERMMREMGGSVSVTSTVGDGSCFWLDFPENWMAAFEPSRTNW